MFQPEPTQRRLALAYEHRLQGGIKGTRYDWEVIESYGHSIETELRALASEVAVMDFGFLTLVRATGADALRYLNKLSCTDLGSLERGVSRRAVILQKEGRVDLDFEVFEEPGGSLLLLAPPSVAPDRLITTLDRELFSEDVKFEDVGAAHSCFAILGPNMGWLARAFGASFPPRAGVDFESAAAHHAQIIRSRYTGGAMLVLLPEDRGAKFWNSLQQAVQRMGGACVGCRAFDTFRIEAGIPWPGVDYDSRHSPLELGMRDILAPTKFDFPGKGPLRAAMENPQPERQLVGINVEGQTSPLPGSRIIGYNGRELGVATSCGWSTTFGRYIALGIIHHSMAEPGSAVLLVMKDESLEGQIAALPFAFPSSDTTPSGEWRLLRRRGISPG